MEEGRAHGIGVPGLRLRLPANGDRVRVGQNDVRSLVPGRHEIVSGGLRWIDIVLPTRPDMDALGEEFGFHELALEDCLSRVQRPKLDDYDDYIFVVLHFPRFNKVTAVTEVKEIDFFLGPDYLVTVHSGELRPLVVLRSRMESDEHSREQYMHTSAEMLMYQIVDRLTDYLFPMMARINQNLDGLEDRIFGPDPRPAVRDLASYRRDLISLRRMLGPNRSVISLLENRRAAILREDMEQYWGDISDHFARVSDMLGEFNEEVASLDSTFNTLYNYRTNETLRALTLISVILLPLTLITGVFGMNVAFPWVHEHSDSLLPFFGIVAGMLVVVGGFLAFFGRKGWL